MNEPTITVETIEHLDFNHSPECEGVAHNDASRPPAQLWIQLHDCGGAALCVPCQQAHADWVEAMLRGARHIHCSGCRTVFVSYRTLVTQVMPI